MTYTVKADYLSNWGEEVTDETVITQEELERLADEWEKPVAELKKQLIPNETYFSLDNGRTYLNADEGIEAIQERAEESELPFSRIWEIVASFMDDDIREQVHAELAPCTERDFLARYLELSPHDLIIN